MSRSLYSDYQTVVGFYLRLMGLLKHIGIDVRSLLLDHCLVEYCARIPADLKIKGMADTKYIPVKSWFVICYYYFTLIISTDYEYNKSYILLLNGYIFKKDMEKVLPHDIVYRKDKLGYSIPMKNWMRDNPTVKQFVGDQLSESAIKRRGLFNPAFIQGLMDQHVSKKANFSHRLWALAVLELWLGEKLE